MGPADPKTPGQRPSTKLFWVNIYESWSSIGWPVTLGQKFESKKHFGSNFWSIQKFGSTKIEDQKFGSNNILDQNYLVIAKTWFKKKFWVKVFGFNAKIWVNKKYGLLQLFASAKN